MKEIALIILMFVCLTISGQTISQSNNRYRGNDAYNGGTVLLLYVLSTASVACNKRTVPLLHLW
jgi:hypothetical protein